MELLRECKQFRRNADPIYLTLKSKSDKGMNTYGLMHLAHCSKYISPLFPGEKTIISINEMSLCSSKVKY